MVIDQNCFGRAGARPYGLSRQRFLYILAKLGYGLGELRGAARGFAQPERNARWLSVRILDSYSSRVNPQDSPGSIAELENVTSHTFHGKIFIDRSNKGLTRLNDYAIIGIIRDRTTR